MANTYRNVIVADGTTDVKTIYTCPAETVALVKSVSAYNTHATDSANWILKLYDAGSTASYVYKGVPTVTAATKVEFVRGDESTLIVLEEGDKLQFQTTVTTANLFVSVLQQDRT